METKALVDSDFMTTILSFLPDDSDNGDTKGKKGKRKRNVSQSNSDQEDHNLQGKKKKKKDRSKIGMNKSDTSEVSDASDVSLRGTDDGGNVNLHDKIQKKIKGMKEKRTKLTREDILSRRHDRKRKKKMERRKNKKNLVKTDSVQKGSKDNDVSTKKPAPTFNKEGKLVFSKFDFSTSKQSKPKSVSGLIGKDYKKILGTLEKRKEKFAMMKEENLNAAFEKSKKDAYHVAMSKVEGLKVKDDEFLVKKALKRKDKKKLKSAKKWKSREDTIAKQKREKQDSRMQNINARKQQKVANKIKRAKKRGRVAGF